MDFLKGNFLFLAPMAGYTNGACRRIFRESGGADGCVSEFVYCRAVLSEAARVFEKMAFDDAERPFGIQIFGSDPREMADAASLIEERLSPDFIDVNFGCPAPNAVGAGAGSALLRDVPRMSKIVSAMAGALKKTPVTAKMRSGWSLGEIAVPRAALALQDAGAKMITLHGRTKSQGYSGDADWDLIERTARSLSIPLIGNGSAEKLSAGSLRGSACAGFMIGRAALGNPWVFLKVKSEIEGREFTPPTPAERARLALRYARLMCDGRDSGVSPENITHIRSQTIRFLKGGAGFKKARVEILKIKTLDELENILCGFF